MKYFYFVDQKRAFLLALVFGCLLSLSQEPLANPYIIFFVLPIIGYLWTRKIHNIRSSFTFGWAFGIGYFSCTLFWIVSPFLVKPDETAFLAPFALFAMGVGLGLLWAIAFIFPMLHIFRKSIKERLLLLALSLTLTEFVRSFLFTGFPWAMISTAFVDVPIGQTLAIFGPYWLNGIIFLFGLWSISSWSSFFLSLLCFTIIFVYGVIRVEPVDELLYHSLNVRIVQPNIPQQDKWKKDYQEASLNRLIKLSEKTHGKADVVIWPETAVTTFFTDNSDILGRIVKSNGGITIFGARRYDNKENELFNSAFLLNSQGDLEGIYDKKHLVPFGEFVPLGQIMMNWGFKGLATNGIIGFTPGNSDRIFDLAGLPPLLVTICYEIIFSSELSNTSTGAEWILNITNDAWFGTFSGPQQHLIQARARAIEQGLPVVRAANTGISAVIDPYGRVLSRIEQGRQGRLDVKLPRAIGRTLYSTVGANYWNFSLYFIFALTTCMCLRFRLKNVV